MGQQNVKSTLNGQQPLATQPSAMEDVWLEPPKPTLRRLIEKKDTEKRLPACMHAWRLYYVLLCCLPAGRPSARSCEHSQLLFFLLQFEQSTK